MERLGRASLATFYALGPYTAGGQVTLGEAAAHHMRVRRVGIGERVALVDGVGGIAEGTLLNLAKRLATVEVDVTRTSLALPDVHMVVPIADRDRMLWLAEKCAELGASSWRPLLWRRSRSVTPRGEGPAFAVKLQARLTEALAQSTGAWLPLVYPESTVERLPGTVPEGTRLLLDPDGAAMLGRSLVAPVTIAVGPEGGIEADERERLLASGFAPVSLAGNILRFETAGVAALAIARAHLAIHSEAPHG